MHAKLWFAVLVAWLALSPPLSADAPPLTFTLDNGLEVLCFERREAPLVSLQFSVRHGNMYAAGPQSEGIAHFYEHMLFKANSLTKSQAEFMQRLTDLGAAGWNGSTGNEAVTYFLTVPARELERTLELWSAVLCDARFDEDELRREISVVSNEIEGNRRLPARMLGQTINRALYGATDLYRTGHYETVQMGKFTRELLVREQRRWYVPDNCLVAIAGNVAPERVRSLVTKYFARWQRGTPRPEIRPLSVCKKATNVLMPGFTNPAMARLYQVWAGPDILTGRDATVTADVLATLLSEKSGPFIRGLAADTALFSPDSASFSFSTGRFGSEFILQAEIQITNRATLATNARVLFDRVRRDLSRIAAGTTVPDTAALARVVRRMNNERIFRNERPAVMLQDLSWWWCVADLAYWSDYSRALAQVTPRALRELAARWLAAAPALELVWVHDDVVRANARKGAVR